MVGVVRVRFMLAETFRLQLDGFSGETIDVDHIGALRHVGHVDYILLAVEGGADHGGAVAVVDGEQVLLGAKAVKLDCGGVDNGVGEGDDALSGRAIIDKGDGADELLGGSALVDEEGVAAVEVAAGVLIVGFGGTLDGVVVQIPLEGVEEVLAVVDADNVVEDTDKVLVREADPNDGVEVDFLQDFIADGDAKGIGAGSAVDGDVEGDVDGVGAFGEVDKGGAVLESLCDGVFVEGEGIVSGCALGNGEGAVEL